MNATSAYGSVLYSRPDDAGSLASAAAGEPLRVQTILFDSLRHACRELGVHEGDLVRCRRGTGSQLVLETDAGRTVALQREWARFIQVSRA